MAGSGRKNADDLLVATLAGGATVQAAAQLCEVSERTIHRRLREVEFKRQLTAARADMVARALGHLAAGSAEAAVVLRNLLSAESDAIKLAAARSVLELGTRLREGVENEERLAALEQQVGDRKERG